MWLTCLAAIGGHCKRLASTPHLWLGGEPLSVPLNLQYDAGMAPAEDRVGLARHPEPALGPGYTHKWTKLAHV